jgi:hypothetical protein
MQRFTLLLAVLSLALPGAATACEVIGIQQLEIFPRSESDMPLNGYAYMHANRSSSALRGVEHPDGSRVKWVGQPTDFDPDLQRWRPAGGWQIGPYVQRLGTDEDQEAWPLWTVVDEIDETPPEIERVSWTGQNAEPPPLCGAKVRQGVVLHPEADEPVLWYRQVLRDGEITTPFHVVLSPHHELLGDAGEEFTVEYMAVDLAGNSTEPLSTEVIACSGCSGSLAGGGVFGLLPLLALVRRRSR